MPYPSAIQKLIELLRDLPSVGPKTAERYAFHLLKKDPAYITDLSRTLGDLHARIIYCSECGDISEQDPCRICSDGRRNHDQLCLVANSRELASMEATGQYKGLYHILGGLIDAIDGIGPEQLDIQALIERIDRQHFKELLIALSPSIEGETTTMFVVKALQDRPLKISRLARGLPAGAELEYADELTLGNAIRYRSILK